MCTQGVNDDYDVDHFLDKRTVNRLELAGGEDGHQANAEPDANQNTLLGNLETAPRDLAGICHMAKAVLHDNNIGRLAGGC